MYSPRPSAVLVVGAFAAAAITGCTRSSDALPSPRSTPEPTAAAGPTAGSSSAVESGTAPMSSLSPVTTTVDAGSDATATVPVATPFPVAEVAEVGVPGLDSDDAFCASWSRFAGSFQVVAVTAAFGSGPPEQLSSLEVAASPTVTAAYDELFANWPEELASEADLVAEDFLGPFARRLDDARSALTDVGADAATIDTIASAWVEGLARRDPSTPEFVLDLPDETWATIDAAAQEFAARRVAFGDDPSLVTDVRTPLTDEYLATSCPDQGTLSGQEIDAP